MPKGSNATLILLLLVFLSSCRRDDPNRQIEIPDFNLPQNLEFRQNLSAYNIFKGNPVNLEPNQEFQLLELSSGLFTDYAYKQRLIKVPTGQEVSKSGDGILLFPNGTVLTKTFYYYNDETDTSQGKRLIETRLLIKNEEIWNAATYIWDEEHQDAVLAGSGADISISWTNDMGVSRSTGYHVPTNNECMACHQANSKMTPLGPTLRNLNQAVSRNNTQVNQLDHLQNVGVLQKLTTIEIDKIVNYSDLQAPLSSRARAYLDMNCAHCHNPNAWQRSAESEFDFRYELPLSQTGILNEKEQLSRALDDGEMPLLGTSLIHEEGVALIIEYLDNI